MDLKQFATDDYQKRGGGYPKSNIPTSIDASDTQLEFSFKNTDEETGKKFVSSFCSKNGLTPKSISSCQDGDFHNDWIVVSVKF